MIALALVLALMSVSQTFDGSDGPLPEGWSATYSGWRVESQRVAPPTAGSFSEATMTVGPSDGLSIAADVSLSPTPQRANGGLTFMWRDHANHLFCKIEVTAGNPNGLISIGRRLGGQITSLTAYRRSIGLRNGETYRLTVARVGKRVSCSVAGGSLVAPVTVSRDLTSQELTVLGGATRAGLRVKVLWDEDDGRTRWDNFAAW